MTRTEPRPISRVQHPRRRGSLRRSGVETTRPPQSPRNERWRDPLVFGLIAAVISAAGSWIPSKWNDEAATQTAATRSLGELWRMMQSIDAVHGTYYAFMHSWIVAFGTSNFALRAPSILAVGVAAAGVVVLGKRLGTRRIALWSAIVFAVLPRVTWMGMEARSSAMTAAVAVWLTIVVLAAVDRRRASWWWLYAILAAFGVMLNVYLALLVLAHGIVLVVSRRRIREPARVVRAWMIAAAAAAVLSAPITFLVLRQSAQLPFGPMNLGDVANTLLIEQYFVGATPTVGRFVAVPPTTLWATAAIVLACLGWVLMAAPVIRHKMRPLVGKNGIGLVTVAVAWILVPLVLILALSYAVTPMYTARYFCFTTPAVALLIGTSISAFSRRWQRVVVMAVLVVLVLPIYVSQRGPTAKNGTDWQQAAAIIQQNAKPGQDIYYGPIRPGSSISTSKVRDAYPGVLSSLHDITLRQSGVQQGRIWDSQWPLTHARAELHKTTVLWAIMEHYGTPSPASTKQERYIERNGLHLAHIWRGPSTDVLLFTR